MKSNYPYIIAGLPVLSLDFDATGTLQENSFHYLSWCETLHDLLSVKDKRELRLLRMGMESSKLNHLFYAKAASSRNAFIRDYFAFDMEMRNITAAYAARTYGLPLNGALVGENAVTEKLYATGSEDFDLGGISDLAEPLHKIMQDPYPLEREERLDQMRWEKAGELVQKHYIDLDVILAFVVKGHLVDRWLQLDRQRGTVLFKQMVADIQSTYKKA